MWGLEIGGFDPKNPGLFDSKRIDSNNELSEFGLNV